MRATEFEFRHRFWSLTAVFTAGFLASRVDRTPALEAAARALGAEPGTAAFHAWVAAGLWVGAALVVLAAAIRTWAAAWLSSDVVHDQALHAESLVADGPYRHVRNPLYLGLLLMAAGLALAASRLGMLVMVAGTALVTLRLIGREERELLASQGAAFAGYCRAVPRLLPSPAPRLPPSGRRPRLGQALLGEAFFWVFAAAAIVFAATRDGRLAACFSVGAVLLYALLMPLWKRRRVDASRHAP